MTAALARRRRFFRVFRVLWASVARMKSRREIVENWLPRYTGVPLKNFGEYILLTNFDRYVELFA